MHCGACSQGMTRHEADCSMASALQLPTTNVVLEGHHTRAAVPGRGSPPAPRWLGKGLATCHSPSAPGSPLDQRRPPPTSWAHRPPCCPTWACMRPRSVNDGYGAGGAPCSVCTIDLSCRGLTLGSGESAAPLSCSPARARDGPRGYHRGIKHGASQYVLFLTCVHVCRTGSK